MNIPYYYLQNATVLDFYKKNDEIYIKLEDIETSQNTMLSGLVKFSNVSNVSINSNDGNTNRKIEMFYPEGSLERLLPENSEENKFLILIGWIDYKLKMSKTISYHFYTKKIDWILESEIENPYD